MRFEATHGIRLIPFLDKNEEKKDGAFPDLQAWGMHLCGPADLPMKGPSEGHRQALTLPSRLLQGQEEETLASGVEQWGCWGRVLGCLPVLCQRCVQEPLGALHPQTRPPEP